MNKHVSLWKVFTSDGALGESWGAYHLSEWTCWDDRWIMVRVFPKSANQPNEIALTIFNSISRNCFRLMIDWKLENLPNGKETSVILFRTAPLEVVQFPNGFPGKLLFHLTFNRNSLIFLAKWWALISSVFGNFRGSSLSILVTQSK